MDKKRVLFVDKDPLFARLVKLTLEKGGRYQVLEETDPATAWLSAHEFQPDIIFLEIALPIIDINVAEQIRSDPMLAHIPIVFITDISSSPEPNKQIGGVRILAKPVSFDALTRCLAEEVGE